MEKLMLERKVYSGYTPHGHATLSIISALPFYLSSKGKYQHIVRNGQTHWRHGKLSHTSISFWCGNSGFVGNGSGQLHAELPDDGVLCATCAGRAVGAGLSGERVIKSSKVMYSPREGASNEE